MYACTLTLLALLSTRSLATDTYYWGDYSWEYEYGTLGHPALGNEGGCIGSLSPTIDCSNPPNLGADCGPQAPGALGDINICGITWQDDCGRTVSVGSGSGADCTWPENSGGLVASVIDQATGQAVGTCTADYQTKDCFGWGSYIYGYAVACTTDACATAAPPPPAPAPAISSAANTTTTSSTTSSLPSTLITSMTGPLGSTAATSYSAPADSSAPASAPASATPSSPAASSGPASSAPPPGSAPASSSPWSSSAPPPATSAPPPPSSICCTTCGSSISCTMTTTWY